MNSKMNKNICKKTANLKSASLKLCSFLGLALLLPLAACNTQQVTIHGAVITQDQVDLVPVGSSRDQVLLSLGTPSTTGTFDNEVFYYISQAKVKTYAYQKGKVSDQRVFAVYFDKEQQVNQLANYGLQEGKVFDFISRTTPTGGKDNTFLGQLLRAGAKPTLF